MLIATAIALFLVGCVITVCEVCREEELDVMPPLRPLPTKREPKPLLPDGCRLVQLANGNFHVCFPCGEELLSSGGEGWTLEQARRACEAVIGEAKRRREIECEGR